jgi:hypothetical protein
MHKNQNCPSIEGFDHNQLFYFFLLSQKKFDLFIMDWFCYNEELMGLAFPSKEKHATIIITILCLSRANSEDTP